MTLRQIGAYINRMHVADAIDVLLHGDGNSNAAAVYTVGTDPISGTAGTLTYDALVDFWSQFDPYAMNTLLVGDAMAKILKLDEMQDGTAGLTFQGTGKLVTPMGATLLRSSAVPSGTILGLDKNYGAATCWWSMTSSSTASWSGRPSPPSPALRRSSRRPPRSCRSAARGEGHDPGTGDRGGGPVLCRAAAGGG